MVGDSSREKVEGTITKLTRKIFGDRAAFYTSSAEHKDPNVLNRLLELAQIQPSDCVLDVATGTGHTAFAFAPRVKEVIATDITPEMLAEAQKLKSALGIPNMEFSLADAHQMPFRNAAFDILTCRRAAHHFMEIDKALLEMERVLKTGGRLIIDDRSVPEDDFVDATLNRLDVLHDPSHVREYRPREWAKMMQGAGFDVQTIEPYTKLRPISAFTTGVEPGNVAKIERIVAALDPGQRRALNVTDIHGEMHLNHWFVIAVGIKT